MAASVWMKFSNERGLLAEAERAALGGDDADGEGVLELERVADGDGPVTLADAVGVAERNVRQRLAGVDLQESDVGGRVAADDLGVDGVAAGAVLVGAVVHLHLAGAFDDVVVGEDVAVGRNDEARAAGDLLVLVVIVARDCVAARRCAGRCGFGKKNSNGIAAERAAVARSLVLMTSVEVIETTAGMTRAATSANDGIVTAVTGACRRSSGWPPSARSTSASGRGRR